MKLHFRQPLEGGWLKQIVIEVFIMLATNSSTLKRNNFSRKTMTKLTAFVAVVFLLALKSRQRISNSPAICKPSIVLYKVVLNKYNETHQHHTIFISS